MSSSGDNFEITLGFFLLKIFIFILSLSSLSADMGMDADGDQKTSDPPAARVVDGQRLPYMHAGNRTSVSELSLQLQL